MSATDENDQGATKGRESEERAPSGGSAATTRGQPPSVDFSTFILSLGTTALYQLGLVPDPSSQQSVPADPLVARQTIETLEMLREKTLGNLDEDERKLIDSLLYEIRTKFVELSR